MWKRTANGRELHFYLAGINNQNFLMRDKETGTWWQQITGRAIYGPMQGASLELVPSDELTFGEWKSEISGGKVFAPVAKYAKEYDSNWEPEVAKLPVVISFPGTELKSRDVVVGLELDGTSRAYPWDTLVKQSPVVDRVHGTPLLVAVGPDGKSFRVFISRIEGKDTEFFLKGVSDSAAETKTEVQSTEACGSGSLTRTGRAKLGCPPPQNEPPPQALPHAVEGGPSTPSTASAAKPWTLLDTTTASEWNFQGCAISGPSVGKCLDRVPALKDYWFDWRNYHADTSIYEH